jgi:hypothetical protein
MKVNEARRAEGLSSVPDGDTVQQAVNMAPLGWVPSNAGGEGDQGSNQTGVPGEGAMAIRIATRRMIRHLARDEILGGHLSPAPLRQRHNEYRAFTVARSAARVQLGNDWGNTMAD